MLLNANSVLELKIAGCKRPALVDPSHKVCQGGKGSVWDGQTYGRTDGHIQSTSGPLPVHFPQCSPKVFNCQKIGVKRDIHG